MPDLEQGPRKVVTAPQLLEFMKHLYDALSHMV